MENCLVRPNIVAITEVKSKNKSSGITLPELNIDGYTIYSNSLDEDGHRGVLIYVDNKLTVHPVELSHDFKEHIFITVTLCKGKQLLFGNIYRSPSSVTNNDDQLCEAVTSILGQKFEHVILVGDFNMPHVNWSSPRTEAKQPKTDFQGKFLELVSFNSLSQHVIKPTRQRGQDVARTLDLILTRDNMQIDLEYLGPLGMSDHSVLFFSAPVGPVKQHILEPRFIYSKGDYNKLREMASQEWKSFPTMDVDTISEQIWSNLKISIYRFIKECVPVSKPHSVPVEKYGLQPFTSAIGNEIKRKHRLWTRYMETKEPRSRANYNKQRNRVKQLSRQVLVQEQEKVAKMCKNNPKKFWRYVSKSVKSTIGVGDLKLKLDDGTTKLLQDDHSKAEALANFYSSMFTQELDEGPILEQRSVMSSMTELKITEMMVYKKLEALRVDKSPGDDKMHPRILYELRSELSGPLSRLFQVSLDTGELPQDWKSGVITALHKKGSRFDIGNYRPVSLTSVVSKVFESIIRDYVMEHLITNKLISNRQYGFCKGRSTLLQLLHVADRWTSLLEQGGQIDIIYTDLEKAFDKVPHRRLLNKLRAYGIDAKIISWIKAFLTGRKQRVRINGSYSEWKDVLSGVPQGSVLGPLLFIIYINDLPEICGQLANIYLFADDAKLCRYISDEYDQHQLQQALYSMQDWTDRWLLKLNIKKCKLISLGKKADQHNYCLKQGNLDVILESVSHINDLGIEVDEKLDFGLHIQNKVNKAFRILGVIRRSFRYLNKSAFILIYKSMVRSGLEYNVSVWAPHKESDIEELERVQRRATKMLSLCKNRSYEERLRYLALPTLKYRRYRADMIQVYNILNGIYDKELAPHLELSSVRVTRGHNLKLETHRTKYNLRKYFFTNRAVNIWNSLSQNVVSAATIQTFKQRLDVFWTHQDCKYNYKAKLTGASGHCLEL